MAKTDSAQNISAEDQYKAAFDETGGPSDSAGGGDDFGITPPADAVAAADADGPADEAEGGGESAETTAEPTSESTESANSEAAEDAPHGEQPAAGSDAGMTEQQLKSWEGRLKKMEADLKAKPSHSESAGVEALEDGAEKAEDSGDEPMGEAMEQAAEQVESGAMTLDQAMKSLAEDFGEPFVKMIEAIASAKAGEIGKSAVDGVANEVKDIIAHISDSNERNHFEKIEAACPDFNDLRQDPAFLEFVASDPANQEVAASGGASDVIALIKTFKDQAPQQDSGDTPAAEPPGQKPAQDSPEGADVDAATGVRSSGMSIPDKPAESDDYEGAFAEASRRK